MTARLLSVAVLVALSFAAQGCSRDSSPIYELDVLSGTPEAQGFTTSVEPRRPEMKPPACEPKTGWVSKTDLAYIHFNVLLRKDGTVEKASLHHSDVTEAGCDDATVKAVRQWQFPRYLKDGQPVRVRFVFGIGFPFHHQ